MNYGAELRELLPHRACNRLYSYFNVQRGTLDPTKMMRRLIVLLGEDASLRKARAGWGRLAIWHALAAAGVNKHAVA